MNGIVERTTGGSPGSTSSTPKNHSVSKEIRTKMKAMSAGYIVLVTTLVRLCAEYDIVYFAQPCKVIFKYSELRTSIYIR